MARRRHRQHDSMEMLLDTMCNTFGGIILIALLVALVSHNARLSEASARAAAESAEIVQRRSSKAEEELRQAQAAHQELLGKTTEPRMTARIELAQQRQELRQQLQQVQQKARLLQEELSQEISSSAEQVAEQIRALKDQSKSLNRQRILEHGQLEAVREQIQKSQQNLQASGIQLTEETQQHVRKLRFPREHSTQKRPLDIIVRFGQLYPVHFLHQGAKTKNTSSLDWQPAGNHGEWVLPKADKGLKPSSDAEAIIRFFKEMQAANHYVVFQVYEDSFSAFIHARETALQQGLEYSWVPLENYVKLMAGAGGEAPPPL